MVRLLLPWTANVGKRLVKNPKIYIKDSGIFHSLMTIESQDQLFSNPKLGASWEGFALESAAKILAKEENELYFWHTHGGAELDLFWQKKGKNWGAEFKFSDAPTLTKSMRVALQDLKLNHLWVIYPGSQIYALDKKITALPLSQISQISG